MYNPESYTQSTRTSSVSYSKIFPDIGLTISTAFNLSQNMRDSSIAVTLPTLSVSLARLYPFKRKKQVGAEKWYEKISLSYTGTLSNSITTKENKLFHRNLLKDWRNGMQHQIPIQATFQLFKYINVTPSFNFTDRMYTNKVMQSWDSDEQTVKRDTLYGFYNVYNFSMNLSMNTKLYGFYRPTLGFMRKKIEAVRHVFTPTVSFSYAPAFSTPFWGMYETYTRTNSSGEVETVTYSPYSGGIYGTAPSGKTGMVTMDVSNNIEMKVRSDRDSTGFRKISLIDELGASLSYNMAAEKRPWSDLTTRLRLKLTKSYTFSMTAVFATYAYELDKNGNPYVGDQTEWSKGRFGRFQGMSQNISYTFNNGTLKKLINFFTGKKEDPDALAKKEAEDRRAEYDRIHKDAMDKEEALQREIDARIGGIEDAQTMLRGAEERIKEAQGLLDEANGIHATPEVTEALIASVNQQHADIEQQNALIEQLATNEKSLRDSTRGKRVMFIGVIAAAVVLLIVILFLIFGPK